MKHAKKLLAVMMVLAMVAAFSAIAFAANPQVVFTVGEYKDGKATVTAVFSDCVGMKDGELYFGYAEGAVTKIAKKNGSDVKAIGDVDNSYNNEFNSGINPAKYGFYFKENLWDSATWADAEGADETVNGENFQFATFEFTATEGTVITVTGGMNIGGSHIDVNDSFTIGTAAAPVETTTAAPAPVETTVAPVSGETTTAAPVSGETTTAAPVSGETTTAAPVSGETTTALPTPSGETTTAAPSSGETTTARTTPGRTTPGTRTDNGHRTGDNSVLAVVAGVIALAGAAFVVTKKRK